MAQSSYARGARTESLRWMFKSKYFSLKKAVSTYFRKPRPLSVYQTTPWSIEHAGDTTKFC